MHHKYIFCGDGPNFLVIGDDAEKILAIGDLSRKCVLVGWGVAYSVGVPKRKWKAFVHVRCKPVTPCALFETGDQ